MLTFIGLLTSLSIALLCCCLWLRQMFELNNLEKLENLKKRLSLATSTANIGVWEWNILNNTLVWDDSMFAIYGLDKSSFVGVYDAWLNAILPEDRTRAEQELQQSLKNNTDFDTLFHIRRFDKIRFIKACGRVVRDGTGNPVRMVVSLPLI